MTRRKLARIAAIVATPLTLWGPALGLLAGCGGGGDGKPLTETDFCAQKADAECQVTERCVSDKAMCKAARMQICTQFVADAKASTKRLFVPGNVGACINMTKSVYAKTSAITPKDFADMDDACNYVFQGKGVVQVDECDVKYDCADRVICDKGFCAKATTSAAGTPCAGPGAVCAAGSYCAMNTSGNLVCTAKGANGEICDGMTPCLENLRCAAGSCTARVDSAGACTSSDDCVSTAPYCDPSAGNKCDMGLLFAPNASSCDAYGGTGTGTGGSGGGAGGSGGGAGGAGGGAGGSVGGGGAGGMGGNGGNQDAGPG